MHHQCLSRTSLESIASFQEHVSALQATVIVQPIPTTDEGLLPIAQLNNTSCLSASVLVNVTGSFSGGASLVVVESSSYFTSYLDPWVASCYVSADKPVGIVPPTTVQPNTSLYVIIAGSKDNGNRSPGIALAALSMSSIGGCHALPNACMAIASCWPFKLFLLVLDELILLCMSIYAPCTQSSMKATCVHVAFLEDLMHELPSMMTQSASAGNCSTPSYNSSQALVSRNFTATTAPAPPVSNAGCGPVNASPTTVVNSCNSHLG